jgi:hypothetical protein
MRISRDVWGFDKDTATQQKRPLFTVPEHVTKLSNFPKGGFFSESAMCFSNLQIAQKNYSKSLS